MSLSKQNNFDKLNVLNYGENKYITRWETIDANKLSFICDNENIFKELLREDKKLKFAAKKGKKISIYSPEVVFTMARNYLLKYNDGRIKVNYIQKKGVGRYNAQGSLSLQCITRQIRQTISLLLYRDYDMKNCHPNILLFICKELKIECSILKQYCENRDKFFKDNELTKDVGKIVMLSLINGGTSDYKKIENPSDDLEEFYENEIKNIHKEICKYHKEKFTDFKDKKIKEREDIEAYNEKCKDETKKKELPIKNYNAKFVNLILCDIESKILCVMDEFFGSDKNGVLVFDGIMLPANGNYDLKDCEKIIYEKLNINMCLEEKPFEDLFDLSAYTIPKFVELKLDYYTDFKNIVGKDIELELLKKWSDNALVLIEGSGKSFFLTVNSQFDFLSKEERKVYEPVKKQHLFDALQVNCNVINNDFNLEAFKEFSNLSEKKQKSEFDNMTDKEKLSIRKNLFNFIVGTSLRPGYLDTIIKFRTNQLDTPIKSYNYVEFLPYLLRLGPPKVTDSFNIFGGYPMEKIELKKVINFEESNLYRHIRNEMMGGTDEKEFQHFLNHVADIIQDAVNIKSNGHVFQSKQGMGKGMIGEFFSKLFGSNHVISFQNTEDYFNNFNYGNTNKLLKIFEEVSEKGDAFKNHNILKGDMSKKIDRIEKKGIDAYNITHCARYWFFTNNENILHVETDDRRFTFHKASNKYANNTEYFEPLWAEVRDEQFCKNAFEYFANRKYKLEDVMTCYTNDYKKEQIQSCLPNGLKFLKEITDNNFNGLSFDETKTKVRAKDLGICFKNWCDENGCRFNLSAFKIQLKKIDIVDKAVYYNGVKAKCYIFNKDILLVKFKDLLKNKDFKFDENEDEDENEE